jgi:DNA-binding SARP family transcriptional activator
VRTSTEPGDRADAHPRRRVRVHVLGEPAILDADGQAIRGVRAKSLELLVFLAVHRGGVAVCDILDAVWPDVPAPRANQRLSTCLSNLRSVVRRAWQAADPDDVHAHGARPEPIVNSGGRYHLDPAIVSVDWWRLLDEQQSGPTPVTDEAISAAAARIADGHDFPWLDNHRDTSRVRQPTPTIGSPSASGPKASTT